MKKKFIAIVALAAMVLTMLPFAAFAADENVSEEAKIDITVVSFNNDVEQYPDVLIIVDGDDVAPSQRVVCYLKGVAEPFYNGVISHYGQNLISVPKTNIPNIDEQDAQNVLTVNITSTDGSKVLASETVSQEYVPTLPKSMDVTIDNGEGNKDRELSVIFDSTYVPAKGDQVSVVGLDEDGDTVGDTKYRSIDEDSLKTNDDGGRVLNLDSFDFNAKATDVLVTFMRNDEDTEITDTVSLEPPYGTLKAIDFTFGDTTVSPGDTVTGKLLYINTENESHDITEEATNIHFTSTAADVIASQEEDTPTVTVSKNAKVGSSIIATLSYNGETYTEVLSVVAAPSDIKMDKTSATAGKDTPLTFNLVDTKGAETGLGFTPTNVDVEWSSTSSAKPTINVGKLTSLKTDGELSIAIKCSSAASGTLTLTFSDDYGRSYEVTTDTFSFKEAGETTGVQRVEMTIGSNIMKVDGKSETLDAAPVVYNSRAMVPLRAFSQAVGAKVEFNASTYRITVDTDDTHIVMTPGSNYYTINGVQKYTDTAPYIVAEYGRAMVPFRVIGEALGYSVDPVLNADGSTAGVVFEAK